ncbi:DMT family transporter [Pseudodonghicola sp.]|uniref:DMT family transporter n=1 Tax=Pseudodonghicola sp. TaxID=1969463 RepID=UPI003A97483D
MSLAISVLCIIPALIALRVPLPSIGALAEQPKWVWLGGVAGVIYVTAAILLVPRLGAAGFMTAVIAGQVIASVAIDHFGGVGLPVRPVETARLVGVGLVTAGVVLVQWPALARFVALLGAPGVARGLAAPCLSLASVPAVSPRWYGRISRT